MINNLGDALLHRSDGDHQLCIKSGEKTLVISVHSTVLKCCSNMFERELNGKFAYVYVWEVGDDMSDAAFWLITMFYRWDVGEIPNKLLESVMTLAAASESSRIYTLLRDEFHKRQMVRKTKKVAKKKQKEIYRRPYTRSQRRVLTRGRRQCKILG